MKPAADVTIRLSKPEDAAEVLKLKDDTWLDAYPDEKHGITVADIRSHISKDSPADRIRRWQGYLTPTATMKNWVAVVDGKIVGFVAAAIGEQRNEIKALYVLPRFQRQGIGSKLLGTALTWLGSAQEIFLNVVAYNHQAIAAYAKAGFGVVGPAPNDPFVLPSGAAMPTVEMVRPK
jgi:ribosomal protein S18 acetylase RimI-like enzyme